jgi:hypothetical protein
MLARTRWPYKSQQAKGREEALRLEREALRLERCM